MGRYSGDARHQCFRYSVNFCIRGVGAVQGVTKLRVQGSGFMNVDGGCIAEGSERQCRCSVGTSLPDFATKKVICSAGLLARCLQLEVNSKPKPHESTTARPSLYIVASFLVDAIYGPNLIHSQNGRTTP